MGSHAKLSPSAAERWLNCPGSVAVPAPPEGESSGHVLERLIDGFEADKSTLAPESVASVETAYTEITKIIDGLEDPGVYTELRVVAQQVNRELWGTADIIIEGDDDLYVIDFKNGAGLEVEIEDNPQLAIYGLGALSEFGRRFNLHLVIVQPRCRSGKVVKSQTIPEKKVKDWEKEWIRKLKIAISDITHFAMTPSSRRFRSGDWCRWCRVKHLCPKVIENIAVARSLGKNKTLDSGVSDTLLEIFVNKKQIEGVLKSAESHAVDFVTRGNTIPGWKLVNKVKAIEELVKKHDISQVCTSKLKSLSVIEKLAGTKFMDKHTVKSSPGVTLAPDGDKRPGVVDTSTDDFEVIDGS
jgi:hypothetical protein